MAHPYIPNLPTFEDLDKARGEAPGGYAPQLRAPDIASSNIGRGAAALGQGIENLGADITDVQKQDDAVNTMQAHAQVVSGLDDLQRTLRESGDYNNFAPAWDAGAKKVLGAALPMVPAGYRDKFAAEMQMPIAQGRSDVLNYGQGLHKQDQQTQVLATAQTYQKQWLDDNATEEASLAARTNLVDSFDIAVKHGIFTPEEGFRLKQNFLYNTSKADALGEAGSNPQGLQHDLSDAGKAGNFLIRHESSGRPDVVNTEGYAGLYQFGAPRLTELGVYTPGSTEAGKLDVWKKLSPDKQWTGTFNIPGFPDVKTLQDFRSNPDAQQAVWGLQVKRFDQEIQANGLDKYIGTTVAGVPITKAGLYAMLHLGSPQSAKAALSGGKNAADDYGTSVLAYAKAVNDTDRYAMLDPTDREQVLGAANRQISINQNEAIKAQREAQNVAATGIVKRMIAGQQVAPSEIATNPAFQDDPRLVKELGQAALSQSQNEAQANVLKYGAGFSNAIAGITADEGDPNRVTRYADLIHRHALPPDDPNYLTLTGVDKVGAQMEKVQKSVDAAHVNMDLAHVLKMARPQLTFDGEYGIPGVKESKLHDPEANIYDIFVHKLTTGLDAWTASGKNPHDFLDKENVDKLIKGMRDPSEMAAARVAALGGVEAPAGGAPEAPPPAPAGVSQDAWASIVAKGPAKDKEGNAYPASAWGGVLTTLLSNPTKEVQEAFNKKFAPHIGMSAADIIEKLVPQNAAPAPAPAPQSMPVGGWPLDSTDLLVQ